MTCLRDLHKGAGTDADKGRHLHAFLCSVQGLSVTLLQGCLVPGVMLLLLLQLLSHGACLAAAASLQFATQLIDLHYVRSQPCLLPRVQHAHAMSHHGVLAM